MTEILEFTSNNQEYEANISLSYEYVEKSIKEIQDISDRTNSQLGVLIGFNLTFIKFVINELSTQINGTIYRSSQT